jgi:ferredoxin
MAFKIFVDRDECIGAGTCVDCAPNVFSLDDEDIAVVTNAKGDDGDAILAAAQDCPQECIYLFDVDTDEQVFP